ncbi:hypothetical protein PoB_002443800 [Plakobranchus ocellatus]|uniref:Uncharacterized protein n=1 Tax=Plakobranchus ocellatus TaxID=259542 RepID=A0AAV3ZU20_9GAST|nr:hypothetical protein PoB_002443800 [Plakobranchus ocellatus]
MSVDRKIMKLSSQIWNFRVREKQLLLLVWWRALVLQSLATNSSSVPDDCEGGQCSGVDNTDMAAGGLPYLILIITLVLCSILLATIALIIIVVVTRHRRRLLGARVEARTPALFRVRTLQIAGQAHYPCGNIDPGDK